MRFVYIGSFRLPNGDAAAARVLNVARALRLAGHEVSFVSWGGMEQWKDTDTGKECAVDGFPYVVTSEIDFKGGIVEKAKAWLFQGERTKRILRERLGQYDAVISYNGSIISWLVGFCRKHKIILVSDLTEWYSYSELKLLDIPGYIWNMYVTQKKVDHKITISSYLADYYKTSHNIVIPATCDAAEEKWHVGKEKAIKVAGTFDGITLIYAGNPARKDAVHHAINAVQRLIDEGYPIRFLLLGTQRETYLKNYSDLLSKKVLSEKIQFMGRISQDDVPSYYSIADFMVLLRESNRKSNAGFPTKFAESMTSGTPVIANLTSDLGNYLKDGETGFVVSEPSEGAIYQVLHEKVLLLERKQIDRKKQKVLAIAKELDYHTFKEPLALFVEHLK